MAAATALSLLAMALLLNRLLLILATLAALVVAFAAYTISVHRPRHQARALRTWNRSRPRRVPRPRGPSVHRELVPLPQGTLRLARGALQHQDKAPPLLQSAH